MQLHGGRWERGCRRVGGPRHAGRGTAVSVRIGAAVAAGADLEVVGGVGIKPGHRPGGAESVSGVEPTAGAAPPILDLVVMGVGYGVPTQADTGLGRCSCTEAGGSGGCRRVGGPRHAGRGTAVSVRIGAAVAAGADLEVVGGVGIKPEHRPGGAGGVAGVEPTAGAAPPILDLVVMGVGYGVPTQADAIVGVRGSSCTGTSTAIYAVFSNAPAAFPPCSHPTIPWVFSIQSGTHSFNQVFTGYLL